MNDYVDKLTMSQAFYNTVQRFPDRTAQWFNPDLYNGDNNGKFTWKEVQQRSELMGCGLLALGLERKQRVSIMASNSPYWTHTDLAVINCGAVLVTIYPTLSLHEASYIVNDSESRYLFLGTASLLDRILPGLDDMPTLEKIIVLDLKYKSTHPKVISLTDLMELGQKNFDTLINTYTRRWQENTLDDWATVLYTSGTTGQGKGVILTHWSMSSRMDNTYRYFVDSGHPYDETDCVLSFLPLSHIFDRACSQWLAIWRGSTIA